MSEPVRNDRVRSVVYSINRIGSTIREEQKRERRKTGSNRDPENKRKHTSEERKRKNENAANANTLEHQRERIGEDNS